MNLDKCYLASVLGFRFKPISGSDRPAQKCCPLQKMIKIDLKIIVSLPFPKFSLNYVHTKMLLKSAE